MTLGFGNAGDVVAFGGIRELIDFVLIAEAIPMMMVYICWPVRLLLIWKMDHIGKMNESLILSLRFFLRLFFYVRIFP